MSILRNIEKFNTHSMDEETLLSVVTGRDNLIQNLSTIIQENIKQPDTIQHIVLIGPRGMGKSFILRYFQIITKKQNVTEGFVDFALLPEEQHNINTASEFIDELLSRIGFNDSTSRLSLWDINHENWTKSVNKLRNEIEKKKKEYGNYLFIAAVENLDILLESVFKSEVDESRFRKLLSGTPNFMLFATSLKSDIDTDYNKRLFYAFQKFHVEPWNEDDYLNYFRKRFELLKQQNPDEYNKKDIGLLTNKLKAISRFTGGSPRMAVVLTNLIFNDDAISTARTLNDVVEDLSPYYQDLMFRMPPRSKILFDTLIREKENISQSELATKVGTLQATISQAFKWLLENIYISGHKVNGEKQYRYSVSDRVFVLFYYKRYVLNGLQCSYIRILADFLISFYDTKELTKNTLKYLQSSNKPEGIEFARLVFQKTGHGNKNINWENYKEVENEIKKIGYKEEINSLFSIAENKVSEHDFREALLLQKEALEKSILENDLCQQLLCFEKIGRDFYELKEYKKSIEYHQKAYDLRKQEINVSKQAWNLGRIGRDYSELEEYKKAIGYHQKSYDLKKQEGDISEQEWNLGQIGWNYQELKEHVKAIEYHQKAYDLSKQEGDISEQEWNLGQIGWNYQELKEHVKAIEYLQKAYDLSKQEVDISGQAWNLARIGWNYKELKEYDKAIEYHQKAYELRNQEGNISEQEWNLGVIGWIFKELKEQEKAIEYHQKAYELSKQEGDISGQAWNFGQIGWNYKELKEYKKAIEYHQKAYELRKQEGDISEQAQNLGQIGVNHLLTNPESAWDLLENGKYSDIPKEQIFKEFGDSVVYTEKWEGKAPAFKIANELLNALKEKNWKLNRCKALSNFFADMLNMKLSFDLLRDICREATGMFGNEGDIIIEAVQHCISYIENGKDENYLLRLNPDMANAVKGIVFEAEL